MLEMRTSSTAPWTSSLSALNYNNNELLELPPTASPALDVPLVGACWRALRSPSPSWVSCYYFAAGTGRP